MVLSDYADNKAFDDAFAREGSLYGYPDGNGMIKVTDTKNNDAKCEFIVKKSTMQNDEVGFYVVVNKA